MNDKLKKVVRHIRKEQERQKRKCEALNRIMGDLQTLCPHDELEITHTYLGEVRMCKICGKIEIIR